MALQLTKIIAFILLAFIALIGVLRWRKKL
jgi:hypothetical protein